MLNICLRCRSCVELLLAEIGAELNNSSSELIIKCHRKADTCLLRFLHEVSDLNSFVTATTLPAILTTWPRYSEGELGLNSTPVR
jgi:hypothetical protein